MALTRRHAIAPEDYCAYLTRNPVALFVKTADLAGNLHVARVALLDDTTREGLDLKYTHALDRLGIARATVDGLPLWRGSLDVGQHVGRA